MIYPGVGLIVVGLLVALALPHWIATPAVIVVLGWILVFVGVIVLLIHLFSAHYRDDRASGGRL